MQRNFRVSTLGWVPQLTVSSRGGCFRTFHGVRKADTRPAGTWLKRECTSPTRIRPLGVEDILTQLHGHSLYHRGQIALLLRAMGAEPVSTDFVFWTRESLGPARG